MSGLKTQHTDMLKEVGLLDSNGNPKEASATESGIVTEVAQSFAGVKDFTGGAKIKGATDGAAIGSGYVGEFLTTTERAGVGGKTYQDYNNTAITNTGFTKMIYKAVNKGMYLVMGISACYRSDSATMSELNSYIAVGGTAITNTATGGISQNNAASNNITCVAIITADNTEIQIYSRVGAGATAASPVHGLSVVRIA